VAGTKFPWSHLNGTTASLVNFAEDLQELNIELTMNMLNHVNPHTGLRYADDPALNFVEFQNEDNIFWSAIERSLEQAPTYRKLLCEKFSHWLEVKYGTQEALMDAWNNEGLPEGENMMPEKHLSAAQPRTFWLGIRTGCKGKPAGKTAYPRQSSISVRRADEILQEI
jgi:hypothetical protein